MPYHVILPLFALAVGIETIVLGILAVVPALRRALPTGWRVLVGSVTGFVLANLGSLLFGAIPAVLALALRIDKASTAADVVAAFAILGLFIGPLVVSPLGFLGGALVALRRAKKRGRLLQHPSVRVAEAA